jgi:hypothetical protein
MAITDTRRHGELAKADLLGQFKGKPRIEALLEIIGAQIDELDAALVDLALDRTIETAIGTQLLQLAKIVKVSPGNSSQEELRARIRAEIRLNRGSGTVSDILDVLTLVLTPGAPIEFTPAYPAGFVVDVGPTAVSGILTDLVKRARLGGVRGQLVYAASDLGNTFTLASGDTPEPSTAQGWGADTDHWVQRTSGTSTNLYAVACGGGQWCAVGDSGVILTSPDGQTWKRQTQAAGYSNAFRGVAYGGGLWVAVGVFGEIQTSPDGIAWTKRTPAGSYAGNLWGVAYDGGGLWVVVGNNAEIQTSPDGHAWIHRKAGGDYADGLIAVAHGDGRWVAVGAAGEIQMSYDGMRWVRVAAADAYASDFSSVACGGGLWVAVGHAEIQTSRDGVTWKHRDPAADSGALRAVCRAEDAWVIVGEDAEIQRSPNGISWARDVPAGSSSLFAIACLSTLRVAVGAEGDIQTQDTVGGFLADVMEA